MTLHAFLYETDLAARLPLRSLVGIAADVAAGLAHLHASGVVHRDVRPLTVLVRMQTDTPGQPLATTNLE
jgi:serine/threonine protein kinase